MRDLNAPLEWWEDAGPTPDRLTIWDPQNANHSPFPSGFKIPKVDSITNARVKRYLAKDVLQVANDDIFPTGDYEISFRKDVPMMFPRKVRQRTLPAVWKNPSVEQKARSGTLLSVIVLNICSLGPWTVAS